MSKRASHTRHIRKAKRPPHAVADPQWLRVREQLLRQMKEQVRRRLGEEPESIRAYTKRWEREMRAPWKPSDKAELVAAVERADVVFGGDFHAFAQAQRTHLKILKALTISRKLVLALEAFAPRHQVWLDQYMAGEMEEVELLRRTRWKTHWGFPWENYRPLVEFIRQQGHGLLAVGSDRRGESLRDREVSAAKTLQGYLQETDHSSVLIYVLFGDLHLASQHLPKIASSCMRDLALRFVTIHLNPEKLYFELARRGLESEIDVLRLGADRFCVIASPPWVQWQSYLMYLENAHDTDLKDDGGEGVDWTDHVSAILHLLAQDLELDFSGDDILVFTAGDARLWLRLRAELSVRELKFARHLIQVGRSFFIPRSGIFFLARPTINHAAELVGHYIHCRLSERTRPLWRMPKDFQALCWAEAVAFFFSKLVNHKRHAETLTDLRTGLAVTSPRDRSRATTRDFGRALDHDFGREALMIALEQRFSELLLLRDGRRREARFQPRHSASWLEAACILGGMMGERLYLAYRSRKISRKALLSLLRMDPSVDGFSETYASIVRRLGPGTGALRTRKERL